MTLLLQFNEMLETLLVNKNIRKKLDTYHELN